MGDDPASHVYVRSKQSHGTEVGFRVDLHLRPETTSLDDVLALVRTLNADEAIDGILVQAPLPAAMGRDAARRLFETIDPAKDVDGFTAENVGRLVQNRRGTGRLHAGRDHRTARARTVSRSPARGPS